MMHLCTFSICLVGFAALALATERQQATPFGGVSHARTR
ncbi:hypothetical protein PAP18089_05219 [Pandoraea apista]|uniref:Uncharacterized protein n=1 Tax=Pandoraea apista TaxID=93218 RepID=A0A5E5PC86_9BURK|nr:hypothetical protein PAP18089_05219 [Pandoraea apista]